MNLPLPHPASLRLLSLLLLASCATTAPSTAPTADADPADTASDASETPDAPVTADSQQAADAAVTQDTTAPDIGPVWVPGNRKLSGAAFFFDATGVGAIDQQKDVTGATAYLLDFPEIQQPVAADGSFTFTGLPQDADFTVAVIHPDYFPSLSPVIHIGQEDVKDVNFQVVTQFIAVYLGVSMGFDSSDPTRCQMVVTVTAMGETQGLWWAPGEPGATVTVEPAVTAEHGPFYFNTSVLPDKSLTMTSTDGGVLVAGAKPGLYTWTAHKDGMTFSTQRLRCEGGWLTNGAPPFGLQASKNGG